MCVRAKAKAKAAALRERAAALRGQVDDDRWLALINEAHELDAGALELDEEAKPIVPARPVAYTGAAQSSVGSAGGGGAATAPAPPLARIVKDIRNHLLAGDVVRAKKLVANELVSGQRVQELFAEIDKVIEEDGEAIQRVEAAAAQAAGERGICLFTRWMKIHKDMQAKKGFYH